MRGISPLLSNCAGLYSRCNARSPLYCSRRYDSWYASNAGIVTPREPEPEIARKLAELEESTPEINTVITNSADVAQEFALKILEPVISALHLNSPETVWIPLVCTAAILRGVYCFVSRVGVYRKIQETIPHSAWFAENNVRKLLFKSHQDTASLEKLKQETTQYRTDNNIRYGDPNLIKLLTMIKGALLGGFYMVVLLGINTVQSDLMGSASFYWIPSLAGADPFYILPVLNIVLCAAVLRYDHAIKIAPKSSGQSSSSVLDTLKESRISGGIVIVSLSLGGICTFVLLSNQIPAYLLLYWVSSNMAGLFVNILLSKSNLVRRIFGIIPHQEFQYNTLQNYVPLTDIETLTKQRKDEYEETQFARVAEEKK